MSKTARNIVEAIQHSLLGSLLRELSRLGFVVLVVIRYRFEEWARSALLPILGGITIGLIVIWLVGFLARPSYRQQGPLGALQQEPPNGFEVWTRLPEGGLRPPGAMRRLVAALGRSPGRKPSRILPLSGILSALGLFALLTLSDNWWAEISPWLSWPEHRDWLAAAAGLTVFALTIRAWASEQRANLAPLDD